MATKRASKVPSTVAGDARPAPCPRCVARRWSGQPCPTHDPAPAPCVVCEDAGQAFCILHQTRPVAPESAPVAPCIVCEDAGQAFCILHQNAAPAPCIVCEDAGQAFCIVHQTRPVAPQSAPVAPQSAIAAPGSTKCAFNRSHVARLALVSWAEPSTAVRGTGPDTRLIVGTDLERAIRAFASDAIHSPDTLATAHYAYQTGPRGARRTHYHGVVAKSIASKLLSGKAFYSPGAPRETCLSLDETRRLAWLANVEALARVYIPRQQTAPVDASRARDAATFHQNTGTRPAPTTPTGWADSTGRVWTAEELRFAGQALAARARAGKASRVR